MSGNNFMTMAERIKKNMMDKSQEKRPIQTPKEVPMAKKDPKASQTMKSIHKSQTKSKFPFDKVNIKTIVE
eukprot:7330068-Prymnesium_polylepis.1